MKPKTIKARTNEKNKEQRASDVVRLLRQLGDLGIPDDHEGIQEFTKISHDFQEHGISMSGRIKLTGIQRVLVYIYSKQHHIESRAKLEFDKYV